MATTTEPYVRNPETGESNTREFLIRFLTSAGGPSEGKDGSPLPATLAVVYDTKVARKEPLYISGPRNPVKRYVGRASKVPSHLNLDETVWVMLADVNLACRQLDRMSRHVLALRFFYDYGDYDIANALDLTLGQVSQVENDALDKLVSILDGTL